MPPSDSVNWMREASRFIRAHRQKTFVVYLGGEVVLSDVIDDCVEDLLLLAGLGIKLVVVHGARPQIDAAFRAAKVEPKFVDGLRVTDASALDAVKSAVVTTRVELEAKLSRAALDTVERNVAIRVVGGTFIVARPKGVVAGTDTGLAGEIRKVDAAAIQHCLHDGSIVLLSPLAYSSSGEAFNMNALEMATAVAGELHANKFIMFAEKVIREPGKSGIVGQLTINEAKALQLDDSAMARFLTSAVKACQQGVQRTHIIDRHRSGAILEELFTRDGCGTLISDTPFDRLRAATIEDIGGILSLIEPLEAAGQLVKRSREKLEMEIDHFQVMVREGTVVACGAVYELAESVAEIACIAVHADYRDRDFGSSMVSALELHAKKLGIAEVFVLTTQAVNWFEELGYEKVALDQLPVARQQFYNDQRNSVVLRKVVAS